MHSESRGSGVLAGGEKSTLHLAMQHYKLWVVGGNSVMVETQRAVVGRSFCWSVLVTMWAGILLRTVAGEEAVESE